VCLLTFSSVIEGGLIEPSAYLQPPCVPLPPCFLFPLLDTASPRENTPFPPAAISRMESPPAGSLRRFSLSFFLLFFPRIGSFETFFYLVRKSSSITETYCAASLSLLFFTAWSAVHLYGPIRFLSSLGREPRRSICFFFYLFFTH